MLEALIIVLILIPVGIYYLLKRLIKAIIFIVVAFTSPVET